MDYVLAKSIVDSFPTFYFVFPLALIVVYLRYHVYNRFSKHLIWIMPLIAGLITINIVGGNVSAYIAHSRNPCADSLIFQYGAAKLIVSNSIFGILEIYSSYLLCRYIYNSRNKDMPHL